MTGKTVSVEGHITVSSLKRRIQQWDGTPVRLQQLIFEGKEMADSIDLSRRKHSTWSGSYD